MVTRAEAATATGLMGAARGAAGVTAEAGSRAERSGLVKVAAAAAVAMLVEVPVELATREVVREGVAAGRAARR